MDIYSFSQKGLRWRQFLKWFADLITPVGRDPIKPDVWERKNKLLRLSGIHIGKHVVLKSGFSCLTGMEENLFIKSYAAIGNNLHIYNFDTVSIGEFSMFAGDITLVNGGHDSSTFESTSGPLCIGRGCWIGNGARIVGPLTVGDNAIIGAGAVVIRDVPSESIVAGVPAEVIGHRVLPKKVWHYGNTYFDPKSFCTVDILAVDQEDPLTLAKNPSLKAEGHRWSVFCFNPHFHLSIEQCPLFLNKHSFRWFDRVLTFSIQNLPKTHNRLTFYAAAGYGSTAGKYDLRTFLNGVKIDRRKISFHGEWVEIDVDPSILRSSNKLSFTGNALSGLPVLKPELRFHKARVADIVFSSSNYGSVLVMNNINENGDIGTWKQGMSLDEKNVVSVGAGWGRLEEFNGEKFRWIEQNAVRLNLLNRTADKNVLVIDVRRGPALSKQALLSISSGLKLANLPVVDGKIVVPLDPPSALLETLELKINPPADFLKDDPRRLSVQVFSVHLESLEQK